MPIPSTQRRRRTSSAWLSLPLLWALARQRTVAARKHPKVKMFILAGEGNIEGFASLGHLHQLAFPQDGTTEAVPRYQHLINNATGQWRVRDDVYITYDHNRNEEWLHGPLTVPRFGGQINSFGPELQMGHVLGDLYEEPVVIVKAGWRGRSLARDFASPSTGHTGFQWYRLLTSIHNTANQLHVVLGPEYRYSKPEIGGLVWWQGYKDMADPEMAKEYGTNLELFLRDIRTELKQPYMPIVVAELGGQGSETQDQQELLFRQTQEQVVNETFAHWWTKFVATAPYVKTDLEIKDYTLYYGRADTMIEISQAFAVALANMDPEKMGFMSNDWFFQEADVSTQRYKTWQAFHFMKNIFLFGVGVFVIVAVVRYKGDFRRTWNTAVYHFRSLASTDDCDTMGIQMEEFDEDDDHGEDDDDGARDDGSEQSIPDLRET